MPKNVTAEQFLKNVQKIDLEQNPKSISMVAAFICCVDGDVSDQEIKKAVNLGKKFIGNSFSKQQFEQEIHDMMAIVDWLCFGVPQRLPQRVSRKQTVQDSLLAI